MKQKKATCKHLKIPVYTPDEVKTVAWFNQGIDNGDTGLYRLLTRLAAKVAEEGRFRRETCPDCQ
jgi:hypothetical protein